MKRIIYILLLAIGMVTMAPVATLVEDSAVSAMYAQQDARAKARAKAQKEREKAKAKRAKEQATAKAKKAKEQAKKKKAQPKAKAKKDKQRAMAQQQKSKIPHSESSYLSPITAAVRACASWVPHRRDSRSKWQD